MGLFLYLQKSNGKQKKKFVKNILLIISLNTQTSVHYEKYISKDDNVNVKHKLSFNLV